MPGSALEEYSRTYGEKLRSALTGGGISPGSALAEDPSAPRGSPNGQPDLGDMNPMADAARRRESSALESGRGPYVPEQDPIVPREPGGTNDPEGGDDMGGPMAQQSALGGEGGYSFRKMWKDAPAAAKAKEVDKLEQSLKRGNQTIDQAYDDLEKQLGTQPEKKRKLSREEKGMLLMEFGLNVLANNKKGLGAIGEAGGKALKGYRELSEGPYEDYQRTKGAVAGARAQSKVKLAEASALESIKQPKEMAGKLPGKFVGDDGYVYFYDEDGKAKKALDEQGKPIKGQASEGGGSAGRSFESDSKYNRYMEIYGVDPRTGEPLTGLALQQVKQDALDFANDRGNSIDDLDLDIQAERSADDYMKTNSMLYERMTASQLETERNRIADARRKRLKRPTRSRLQPGGGEPTRGRPGAMRSFATEADAQAAVDRGEIQRGDTIRIGGREAQVD